jgi:hypothetical protein
MKIKFISLILITIKYAFKINFFNISQINISILKNNVNTSATNPLVSQRLFYSKFVALMKEEFQMDNIYVNTYREFELAEPAKLNSVIGNN